MNKAMVSKACEVKFRTYGTLALPAGLRVKEVPGERGLWFWLDEFPTDLFPTGSMIRHDAVHYGVWLSEDQVQDRGA